MAVDTRTRLVFRSRIRTPIGHVGYSSVYENSRWAFAGYRTIPFYSVTYILEGRCRYTEPSGREVVLVPGDMFFCFPGVPHRLDAADAEGFSEFWISFSGPAFDLWRETKVIDPAKFHMHLEPVEYWLVRFESLFANIRGDIYGQIMLVAGLQSLLAECMSLQQKTAVQGEEAWIAQAKAMIDSVTRSEELDVEDIAARMNMSYSNFRRKFVALAGIPPRRYHTAKLIERACEWMQASSIANREIAQRCGFCNEFHFSKRFKQIVGLSPREYRAQLQQTRAQSFVEWHDDDIIAQPDDHEFRNYAAVALHR